MIRTHQTLFTLAATAMLSLGFVMAQADDEATIRGLIEQYAEFYTGRDAEAVAQLFTEDAIFIGPAGQVIEGRPAILASFQEHLEDSLPLSKEVIEIVVANDTAYSTSTVLVMDPDGETVVGGYSLSIWNRIDGEWMWHRSVNNMILPEPEENDMNGSE